MDLLERELNLKQLQINRLLTITQAINNNVSAEGLYSMYNSFLSWEMGVRKMALYVLQDNEWNCTSHIGIDEALIERDITEKLTKYQRLKNLDDENDDPLISQFDIVVPVLHKDTAIAYTFIGGFAEDEDMYNKVQFITTITNIIAVAIENKRLFKKQIEQERIKRDIELASEMQQLFIPSDLPKGDDYQLASIYKPHYSVGGDYFDFIEFDSDKFAFCIADISGKGVGAALLMANFQANFHSLINQESKLDDFIRALNLSLFRITGGDKFLTFFVAEFDKKTRMLRYVNCGHNPPFAVMKSLEYRLDKGTTILGSFLKMPEIEVGELHLPEEALILTYTDGLTDIKNEQNQFLSDDMLSAFMANNSGLSADAFNDKLMEQIERFKGKQNYPDDFTVLTCKIFS